MIFAVDIGNTNIVVALLDAGAVVSEFRLTSDLSVSAETYAEEVSAMLTRAESSAIDGAVISSVVPPLAETYREVCRRLFGVDALIVSAETAADVPLLVDNPEKAGADLICTAVAGAKNYALPVIIVDMGTATTITVVDKRGNYIGGAIYPGLTLTFNALSAGAYLLPEIPMEVPRKLISGNTVESMQSGAMYGTASMLDGMISRFERELGESASLVATGGLSSVVIPLCEHNIELCPNLIFDGMYAIYVDNEKVRTR
ncbi:MAG: type III pantothenate kinase [Oscillospiraceae bacterium]|jgi:type III pantothenate kinase|nr:type III pantothenate kinase [Oscillospiraceae bacterium]